jgi:hypothetical protein
MSLFSYVERLILTSSAIVVLTKDDVLFEIIVLSLNAKVIAKIQLSGAVNDLSVAEDKYLIVTMQNNVFVMDLGLRMVMELETLLPLIMLSGVYSNSGIYVSTSQGLGLFKI